MTREEAIDKLTYSKQVADDEYQKEWCEALDMAIKALQQEPCGDTIYRQAVLDAIENEYRDRCNELLAHEIVNIMAIIDEVPPTDPTKIGHWIEDNQRDLRICSICGRSLPLIPRKDYYCPQCGAKMVETKESEG